MKKITFAIKSFIILMVAAIVCPGPAHSANPPSINASLSLVDQNDNPTTQTVYRLGQDVVRFAIYQQNVGQNNVIASGKYVKKDFHLNLRLYVTGADGKEKLITADYPEGLTDPPPPPVKPVGNQMLSVEEVAMLPGGWVWKVAFDGKDHYKIIPGYYSARAVIPLTTYKAGALLTLDGKPYARMEPPATYVDTTDPVESRSISFSVIADNDGDGWFFPAPDAATAADCDDADASVNPAASEIEGNGIDDDCDAATPDEPLIADGTLIVHCDQHTVGLGSHPGSEKLAYDGVEFRIFDKSSDSYCMQQFGVSWHFYKSIWQSSETATGCQILAKGITGTAPDEPGECTLSLPPGNYLVIGKPEGEDFYMGVSVGELQSEMVKKIYLQQIVKANGKKSPGKYTKKSGSELLIIEPEFVEWDGTQEYYPIIFDSVGDWSVTTSVDPPEGFLTDHDSLSEEVNTETKAVQFTLTDQGTTWKATKVEHKLKHKGKTEKVKSKIDVKLSKKLAKEKDLSIWGDEEDPWKKKDKDKDK